MGPGFKSQPAHSVFILLLPPILMKDVFSRKQQAWEMLVSLYNERNRLGLDYRFTASDLAAYGDLGRSSGPMMTYMINAGIIKRAGHNEDGKKKVYEMTDNASSTLWRNPGIRVGEVASIISRYKKRATSAQRPGS